MQKLNKRTSRWDHRDNSRTRAPVSVVWPRSRKTELSGISGFKSARALSRAHPPPPF